MRQSAGQLARPALGLGVPLTSVAIALALSVAIIAVSGGDAVTAMSALLAGAFGNEMAVSATLEAMVPLTLVALGWIVAVAAGRISIGFEGQILIGGTLAIVVALSRLGSPGPLDLLLAVLVSIGAGAAYAGVAAWLWAVRGVNEIISTLILNFVAAAVVDWLVNGPLQEPTHSLPFTSRVPVETLWPKIGIGPATTLDIALVPIAALVIWFVMYRTAFGLSLRMVGANRRAASLAGLRTTALSVLALLISGGLAGLAGCSLVLGAGNDRMSSGFSAGYGFEGIVVALIAQNNPMGVVPAALLFAALRTGGPLMQVEAGVSSQVVAITQGLVILLVTASAFVVDAMNARRRHGAIATQA